MEPASYHPHQLQLDGNVKDHACMHHDAWFSDLRISVRYKLTITMHGQ
jgi:hypothetical protein